MMNGYHNCETMPDAVHVWKADESWELRLFRTSRVGHDRKTYMDYTLIIPIGFCPWCGEKLEGADDGEE